MVCKVAKQVDMLPNQMINHKMNTLNFPRCEKYEQKYGWIISYEFIFGGGCRNTN